MHNLYLGTAKRIMKKWTSGNQPLISIHDLKNIQAIINATPPPSAGTGQCPRKISMSWTCPVQISIIFRYNKGFKLTYLGQY